MNRKLGRSKRFQNTIEQLESRMLLTAIINAQDVLEVTGTPGSDVISVNASGNMVHVIENGAAPTVFSISAIQSIIVRGEAGNDSLFIGLGLPGATLDGGPGQDLLTGSDGDDTFLTRDGNADTVDGGLGVDRVVSDSSDTVASVEIVNPILTAADNQTQVVRVLVVSYDPLIPSEGGVPLHSVFNWYSAPEIAARYEQAMEKSSGGAVQYEIVEWRNRNYIPVMEDGFQYTPDQYVANRRTNTGWHPDSRADFQQIVTDEQIVPLVDSGIVDELWLIGDHYFNLPGESWMAGPRSFYINGPVYDDISTVRPFAAMGFSMERPDTLTHNFGHRTEATMNRIYGGWNLLDPVTNWDKFSANYAQSNGVPGVGTAHYPTNGESDYDYGNIRIVQSIADDFLNYPNLTGATTPIDRTAWSKAGVDYQWEYFEWYYQHVPRAGGVNLDGRQNNWWKYLYNFDNYAADGHPLDGRAISLAQDVFDFGDSVHRFQVAYSGAMFIERDSLGDNDVRILGPHGFDADTHLVSVQSASDGPYLVATYEVAAPGGNWDFSDLGQYRLQLQAGAVVDVLGTAIPSSEFGAFFLRSTGTTSVGQPAGTSLLLAFDGTSQGADGEIASAQSGLTFGSGVVGQAVHMEQASILRYATASNIVSTAGTIEFWLRPQWASGSAEAVGLFQVGDAFNNGLLLQIDGAINLRVIQWGDNPLTAPIETSVERGVGRGVSDWQSGQWRHLAATWDGNSHQLALYLDGQLVGVESAAVVMPQFSTSTFVLGALNGGGLPYKGDFDEFRILDHALTAEQIRSDYRAGIGFTAIELDPLSQNLSVGDVARPQVTVTFTIGGSTALDSATIHWNSGDDTVLTVSDAGLVRATGVGSTTLTARLGTLTATVQVTVTNPFPPVATIGALPKISSRQGAYFIQVTYQDNAAVHINTINDDDLIVRGPHGFATFAKLVSLSDPSDGPIRFATYRIDPPGGTWRPEDNGDYSIELIAWQVGDTAGRYSPQQILAEFEVDVPATPSIPANLSPTAMNDTATATAGMSIVIQVLANDFDPDADALTVTAVSAATHGAVVMNSDGTVAYTATPGFAGFDSFTYTISDGNGATATATVDVSVNVLNLNAPVFTSTSTPSVPENTTAVLTVIATDADLPAQSVTYSLTGGADQSKFTITLGGVLTFVTAPDHEAPTDFNTDNVYLVQVTANDGAGGTTVQNLSVTVSVQAVDDSPVITLHPHPLVFHVKARKIIAIDGTATISDVDTPNLTFTGSVLIVSGHAAKDSVSILKQRGIGLKGKRVLFNGTGIGTYTGGKKGAALVVTLTSLANENAVEILLRSIGYKSTDKVVGSRLLAIQITNIGDSNTNTALRQIQVEP